MFTKSEMQAVVRWLEERKEWLTTERLIIECGDDAAAISGKWPRVQDLQREEHGIKSSIQTAREQMEQANE